jgi:CRP-like cAMP-binding protein
MPLPPRKEEKGPAKLPEGVYAAKLTVPADGRELEGMTLKVDPTTLAIGTSAGISKDVEVRVALELRDREPQAVFGMKVVRSQVPSRPGQRVVVLELVEASGRDRERLSAAVKRSVDDIASFLRGSPLFAEFTEEEALVIARLCTKHFLRKGELLLREKTPANELDGLVVIEQGQVRIFHGSGTRDADVIATAGRGEILGELSLVLDQPHTVSIGTVADAELIELPKAAFAKLKVVNSAVTVKLMEVMLKVLARRLGRTTRLLFSPARM